MDDRIADRKEQARCELAGRPRSATTAAAAKMVATPNRSKAPLEKWRAVRAGQIEPGRIQEMVVVVVDAPEDLVDEVSFPTSPRLQISSSQRSPEAANSRTTSPASAIAAMASTQPTNLARRRVVVPGRQQGIAGHRTELCIGCSETTLMRSALGRPQPIFPGESSPAVVSKAFANLSGRLRIRAPADRPSPSLR